MEPDPRFPDRPTHPDLDRLSRAVIANDALVEQPYETDEEDVYRAAVATVADPEVVAYVAEQRIMRMLQANPPRTADGLVTVSSAAWMDGFMAAATMLAQSVRDGQHR